MSYARLAEDSDVYVFIDGGGVVHCCWCSLGEDFAGTRAEVLAHLERHRASGHKVPSSAVGRLLAEIAAGQQPA